MTCLALPEEPARVGREAYHLLHEFTTDIVRLRIARTPEGQAILSSLKLASLLGEANLSQRKHSWYIENFWHTFGEALLIASARFLDVDDIANAELGVTFRKETVEPCLGERELVLYDTAPGGAGYSTEVAAHLKEVFNIAADLLNHCNCGDSCYRCLRSYRNQWIHSRLDRHLVADGLKKFLALNWD